MCLCRQLYCECVDSHINRHMFVHKIVLSHNPSLSALYTYAVYVGIICICNVPVCVLLYVSVRLPGITQRWPSVNDKYDNKPRAHHTCLSKTFTKICDGICE